MTGRPYCTVVVPVLDDGLALRRLLSRLQRLHGGTFEVLVVDGGSTDDSRDVATRLGARVLISEPNRGLQLNVGCRAALGEWIWMLHADSQIGLSAVTYLRSLPVPAWGRFDICFHPENRIMRLVAWSMNRRSRWSGICTGDQGIFVHRSLLERIGGVPEQPLMEDVELSRRLTRLSHPLTPRIRIVTSSRRWHRDGVVRTILRMWRFRLAYWMGRAPEALAREYYA